MLQHQSRGMSNKPIISIVDDDPSVLEATMDLLNSVGFPVETFPRAEEFLNSQHLHSTCCLIADVQMPGISGLELHVHLLRFGLAIPTILITAYADEAERTRALKAGVFCYLIKPFAESELLACIRSALQARKTDTKGQ